MISAMLQKISNVRNATLQEISNVARIQQRGGVPFTVTMCLHVGRVSEKRSIVGA